MILSLRILLYQQTLCELQKMARFKKRRHDLMDPTMKMTLLQEPMILQRALEHG